MNTHRTATLGRFLAANLLALSALAASAHAFYRPRPSDSDGCLPRKPAPKPQPKLAGQWLLKGSIVYAHPWGREFDRQIAEWGVYGTCDPKTGLVRSSAMVVRWANGQKQTYRPHVAWYLGRTKHNNKVYLHPAVAKGAGPLLWSAVSTHRRSLTGTARPTSALPVPASGQIRWDRIRLGNVRGVHRPTEVTIFGWAWLTQTSVRTYGPYGLAPKATKNWFGVIVTVDPS